MKHAGVVDITPQKFVNCLFAGRPSVLQKSLYAVQVSSVHLFCCTEKQLTIICYSIPEAITVELSKLRFRAIYRT